MKLTSGHTLGRSTRILFSLTILLPVPALAQLSQQDQVRIREMAQSLASQPSRIVLKPAAQGVPVGQTSQMEVTLVDADSKPVTAREDETIAVQVKSPSGRTTNANVVIPKGQSSVALPVSTDAAGLATVSAQPTKTAIRPGNVSVLFVPSAKKAAAPTKAGKKSSSNLLPVTIPSQDRLTPDNTDGVIELAALVAPLYGRTAAQLGPVNATASPQIYISVDDVDTNYIANGSDRFQISAYFESPYNSAAPQNIDLWFENDRGSLNPNHLTIAKGAYTGTTNLTSTWPCDVNVRFDSSTPTYQVLGKTQFKVKFVPLNVLIVGPAQFSVIDDPMINVLFVDDNGPVPPGREWTVELGAMHSRLNFNPTTVKFDGDAAFESVVLSPKSVGADSIQMITTGYKPVPLDIMITWKAILAICLAGGIIGGLAAYEQLKGSLVLRVFFGVLGGALLSWVYVFLALPVLAEGNTIGNIAHNTISAFFISLIGGYLGIRVLDLIAHRFGWS